MSIRKGDTEICSLSEWEKFAGPNRHDQWVDGRSAKEAARAWLAEAGTALPAEIAREWTPAKVRLSDPEQIPTTIAAAPCYAAPRALADLAANAAAVTALIRGASNCFCP